MARADDVVGNDLEINLLSFGRFAVEIFTTAVLGVFGVCCVFLCRGAGFGIVVVAGFDLGCVRLTLLFFDSSFGEV